MKIIRITDSRLASAILALVEGADVYDVKIGAHNYVVGISYPDSDEERIKKIDAEFTNKTLAVNLFKWTKGYEYLRRKIGDLKKRGQLFVHPTSQNPTGYETDINLNNG